MRTAALALCCLLASSVVSEARILRPLEKWLGFGKRKAARDADGKLNRNFKEISGTAGVFTRKPFGNSSRA